MMPNKGHAGFMLPTGMMVCALALFGCVVLAVPLLVNSSRGSNTSTATVLINRDAGTVYAEAANAIRQRGYKQITKQDDAKYFLEGVRKGKSATLQVVGVDSDQSRIIVTIENDKDAGHINEAVDAVMQTCRQLSVQCQEQKS